MSEPPNLPPIISIAGRSKVGKTTFLTRLIAELVSRGYRVGVIKHSVHPFSLARRSLAPITAPLAARYFD